MLALLGMIPGLAAVVQGITTAWFNTKVRLVTARIGGDRDVATRLVTAAAQADHENTNRLAIMSGNKLLTFLLLGFATPLVIYEWKSIIVDKVIGPGCIWWTNMCWVANTDSLGDGDIRAWATTIIGFLFGSSTVLAVGKMWFGRDKTGE